MCRTRCYKAKETYYKAKETYYKAKETYFKAKETYYKAKETYYLEYFVVSIITSQRDLSTSQKTPIRVTKETYPRHKRDLSASQKRPIALNCCVSAPLLSRVSRV